MSDTAQSNRATDLTVDWTAEQYEIAQLQVKLLELTYKNKLTHLITYQCFNKCIIQDKQFTGRLGRQFNNNQTHCITDCTKQLYQSYNDNKSIDLAQL